MLINVKKIWRQTRHKCFLITLRFFGVNGSPRLIFPIRYFSLSMRLRYNIDCCTNIMLFTWSLAMQHCPLKELITLLVFDFLRDCVSLCYLALPQIPFKEFFKYFNELDMLNNEKLLICSFWNSFHIPTIILNHHFKIITKQIGA